MKDIIIIDNSPNAYLFQPENALPIISWYEDKSDCELNSYVTFLQELADVDDVRPFLIAVKNEDGEADINKGFSILKAFKIQN